MRDFSRLDFSTFWIIEIWKITDFSDLMLMRLTLEPNLKPLPVAFLYWEYFMFNRRTDLHLNEDKKSTCSSKIWPFIRDDRFGSKVSQIRCTEIWFDSYVYIWGQSNPLRSQTCFLYIHHSYPPISPPSLSLFVRLTLLLVSWFHSPVDLDRRCNADLV